MDTDDRPIGDRSPLALVLRGRGGCRRRGCGERRGSACVFVERPLLSGRVRDRILGGVAESRLDSVVRSGTRRGERGDDERNDERDTDSGQPRASSSR
jgi:hypothetical protein